MAIGFYRSEKFGEAPGGRRAGSAGELPFAWIEGKVKPAFNVHGSRLHVI